MFNLKPAGTPINQTQPNRNNLFVMSLANFIIHMQADSALYNSAKPIKFPKRTSRAILDQMECLCNAAFSAYSTHDRDLTNWKPQLMSWETKEPTANNEYKQEKYKLDF